MTRAGTRGGSYADEQEKIDIGEGTAASVQPDEAPPQGGKFVVSVAGQDLSAKTHPTGGWHHYMTLPIGSATFKETTATLKITPSGPIRGSLMNLRAVRLTPIP